MTQTTDRPSPTADPLTGARSFTEYLALFGLSVADLAGRRILDAPAGPSAFTAGALARGLDAVACDPSFPPLDGGDRSGALAELGLRSLADAQRRHDRLVAAPGTVTWAYFTDPKDLLRRRQAAARYFAAHAAEHPERYLPTSSDGLLPFADGEFDLALSVDGTSPALLRELTRVAREVRSSG